MANQNADFDDNGIASLIVTSNADGTSTLKVYGDSSTNRLLVSATTDIGVAEDTAHQSGDTGVMMLVVRQDSQSNFGADGDYVPMSVNSSGELRVTTSGGTTYTEDDAKSGNATAGTLMMVRDDALSVITPAEGDWNPLRSSAEGALWVQDFNSDAILTASQAIQTAVEGTLTVGSHAVTNAGTFAVQVDGSALTALQLIDDPVIADDAAFTPGTSKVMMAGFEFDDSTPDSVDEGDAGAARMSSRREIYVQLRDAAGNERGANIDASGQLSVIEASGSAIATSLAIMDDWDNGASDGASVSGDVAHDTADAGEPVKVGGKALTAQPTAVAGNDRVNAMFDIYGRQITMNSLREMKGSQITTITSSTSETTVVTANATYKQDVYGVIVTNTSATATEVSFKDDTGGTTRFTISAPANDTRGFMLPMDAAHIQVAANDNWTATCADSVASIIITVLFVKNL